MDSGGVHPPGGFALEGAREATFVLTSCGLLSYVIARLAVDGFVSRFGVTPADVGVGYIDLVSPAAIILGAFVFLWIAWSAFLGYASSSDRKKILSRVTRWLTNGIRFSATVFYSYLIFQLVKGTYLGRATPIADELPAWTRRSAAIYAWSVYGFCMLLVWVMVYTSRVRPEGTPGWEFRPSSWPWRRDLTRSQLASERWLTGLIALMVILPLAHIYGVHKADEAKIGKDVEVSALGFSVPGMYAQAVTVSAFPDPPWLDAKGRCLMYLGQANGSTVFFDVDKQRVLRLSTVGLQISACTMHR